MSTNAYRSEQLIHYSATNQATYFGFHLSTTCDRHDVHPFNSVEQLESFKACVGGALPEPLRGDSWAVEVLAAMAAVELLGDEYQREGEFLLHFLSDRDDPAELAQAVTDAALAWIDENL